MTLYTLYTCREGWQDQLKDLISKLNISVAFDAIAGEMSATMMQVASAFTPINMINTNIVIDFVRSMLTLSDQC